MTRDPQTFLRPTGELGVAADGAVLELVIADGAGGCEVARVDAATCRKWLYRIATSLWVWGGEGPADGKPQVLDLAGREIAVPAAHCPKWAVDLSLALLVSAPRPARARP